MSFSSLLSYYPTYSILDEVMQNKFTKLNIFVDIKNCLQTLYMEHAIKNIVYNTMKCSFPDTSVFTSLISFLSFHKKYSYKRNININFYIFFESGQSYYHKNISSKYKISRRIDDLYGLDKDKRDLFFSVLSKNFLLINKACNMIPGVKVIRLENLEADFIPYYLLRNNLVNLDENTANIVYSNDHDLMQTISAADNVYIYRKTPQYKKIVTRNQVMQSFFKENCNFPDSYLPVAMAIMGDEGDDVTGVKGIGGKTMMKIINDIINMTGGLENLYRNVHSGNPIFNLDDTKIPNKNINKIIEQEKKYNLISNNLKLVSFEVLSRFLDNPISTEMASKKNSILENLKLSNKKVPVNVMRDALERSKVYLEEGSLETIYNEVNFNAY